MPATAIIGELPRSCFICDKNTRRIRSMSHLDGPPTDPKDHVAICLQCDDDWTTAVTRDLIDTPPKPKT